MKKSYFTAIIFIAALAGAEANAYDVNYSHINPGGDNYFDPNNPTVRRTEPFCILDGNQYGALRATDVFVGNKQVACRNQQGMCVSKTIDVYAKKQYDWRLWNDFLTTNMCYRLSCYYQAMAYADLNYVVQPLNKHANIVTSIIAGWATDGRLTKRVGVHGMVSDRGLNNISNANNKFDNRYVHPHWPNETDPLHHLHAHRHWQNGKYKVNNAKNDQIVPTPTRIANYEPGGGTSAFQGLLWSWRILSSNWQGKWAAQSYYEKQGIFPDGQADRATKLPSVDLTKHIIIISDGLDNDGKGNIPAGAIKAPTEDNWNKEKVLEDSSFGFEFNPAQPFHKPGAETCDAHASEESITQADYDSICNEMNRQGITVYAIVFNGQTNNKLKSCVLKTERGVYVDDQSVCSASIAGGTNCQPNPTGAANATYLQDALAKIFAAIASQSVRLVE